MDWTTIAASLAGILRAVEDGRVKVRLVLEVEAASGGRVINIDMPICTDGSLADSKTAKAMADAINRATEAGNGIGKGGF